MKIVKKALKTITIFLLFITCVLCIFWIIPNSINFHYSIETDEKVLAITFDDGPYPPWTGQILALLEREGVKATFYLAGKNLEDNMALGARIIKEGHEVGNHLYNGESLTFGWPKEVQRVFEKCDSLLRKIGAKGNITIRQGRGAGGPIVGYLAWRDNRQQIGASAYAMDWLHPGWTSGNCPNWLIPCPTQVKDEIVADILPSISPGAIILLHDGYDNGLGADRSGTISAAEEIIHYAKSRGYRFVTISELLQMKN